ncbi:MAG: hypothetical protein WCI51_00865 [Lentisphaerota bacterium]
MKMKIALVAEITFRLELEAPPEYLKLLKSNPEIIDAVANGVGSESEGIFYHLTPDTNWLMNINPVSHAHDWMYTFPLRFNSVAEGLAWKRLADHWFDLNHKVMIDDGKAFLRGVRNERRTEYNILLDAGGSEAFWCNKMLPPDFEYYYSTLPPMNDVQMGKFRLIEEKIKALNL